MSKVSLNNEDWGKMVAEEIKEAAEKYDFIREILERGKVFEELVQEIKEEKKKK